MDGGSDRQMRPCLYQGHVMHMRLTPFHHRFRYRVFSLLLDIDRLQETLAPLRLLRLDRFGLLSFRRRDHGPRDGSDLRPWIEAELAAHDVAAPARIMLLCFPRLLGYVFNPLSVYFCEDAAGRMTAVVYQVRNTFGDQHTYVLPIDDDGAQGVHRHGQGKAFFVSPFIGMDQTYRFTLRRPDTRMAIRIRQHDGKGPWLIATQNGDRKPLTDREILRQWLMHPLMTVKIMAAIHWQALKLALKGAKFHPYRGPYPTEAKDSGGIGARLTALLGWNRPGLSD